MSHIGGAPQGSVASLVARWNNGMQDTQDGPSSVSQQQQQHKRQRVTATPARLLPADSPALAHSGGAAAAAAAAGERGAGRQLGFDDAQDSSSDVAAREARLEAIRKRCGTAAAAAAAAAASAIAIAARSQPTAAAHRHLPCTPRFGTKLFLPAHELPPAEQRRQLGAEEADLAPEDYRLRKWEALPVVLSGTSNAWTLNWVLKGQVRAAPRSARRSGSRGSHRSACRRPAADAPPHRSLCPPRCRAAAWAWPLRCCICGCWARARPSSLPTQALCTPRATRG